MLRVFSKIMTVVDVLVEIHIYTSRYIHELWGWAAGGREQECMQLCITYRTMN